MSVSVSNGVAAQLNNYVSGLTDPATGAFLQVDSGYKSQLTTINNDITAQNTYIQQQTTQLQNKFAAMEEAMAQLQESSQIITAAAKNFAVHYRQHEFEFFIQQLITETGMRGYEAYKQAQDLSPMRIDVILELYRVAVESLERARHALAEQGKDAARPFLLKSQTAVMGLASGLPAYKDELAATFLRLYEYASPADGSGQPGEHRLRRPGVAHAL